MLTDAGRKFRFRFRGIWKYTFPPNTDAHISGFSFFISCIFNFFNFWNSFPIDRFKLLTDHLTASRLRCYFIILATVSNFCIFIAAGAFLLLEESSLCHKQLLFESFCQSASLPYHFVLLSIDISSWSLPGEDRGGTGWDSAALCLLCMLLSFVNRVGDFGLENLNLHPGSLKWG